MSERNTIVIAISGGGRPIDTVLSTTVAAITEYVVKDRQVGAETRLLYLSNEILSCCYD